MPHKFLFPIIIIMLLIFGLFACSKNDDNVKSITEIYNLKQGECLPIEHYINGDLFSRISYNSTDSLYVEDNNFNGLQHYYVNKQGQIFKIELYNPITKQVELSSVYVYNNLGFVDSIITNNFSNIETTKFFYNTQNSCQLIRQFAVSGNNTSTYIYNYFDENCSYNQLKINENNDTILNQKVILNEYKNTHNKLTPNYLINQQNLHYLFLEAETFSRYNDYIYNEFGYPKSYKYCFVNINGEQCNQYAIKYVCYQ